MAEGPEPGAELARHVEELAACAARLRAEIAKAVVGQRELIDDVLAAVFAGGHALLSGPPGLARTTLARALASAAGLDWRRIQCTPDMLPSDVVGTEIFESRAGSSRPRFLPGPVFTNLLLADEINRTPPKTQAALVEAMEGQGVTVGNETRPLPDPFMVLATLNTVDSEGVYELPPGSPQLDRFMFSLCTGYPSAAEESEIVERTTGKPGAEPRTAASAEELIRHRRTVRELPAPLTVRRYAAELARMTRPAEEDAPAVIRENVAWGAGPRAGQCLVLGAKARAAMSGRLCVSREDVRNIAGAVLRHRIIPAFHAAAAGTGAERLAGLAVEELDARVRGRLVVGGRVRKMLRLPEPAAAKKKN